MVNLKSRIKELENQNSILERNFNLVLKLNEELRNTIKLQAIKIKFLENRVIYLEKELEKLKVKPNEPSGSKPDYLKQNHVESKQKPGRKAGFKGKSRLNPINIDYVKKIKPNFCSYCNSNDLKIIKTRKKYISDIEFRVVNIEEHLQDVKCNFCGKITKALSNNGEIQSPFGKNTLSLIGYLRNMSGISINNLKNLFKDYFNLIISNSTISNNEILISELSELKYVSYLDKVKESKFSHKDETSYRVKGKTNWIWVYDNLDYVFYRLSETRGKITLINDFGENPKSISINDCYSSYNLFPEQQICWAHLLRELKFHSEKENATFEEVFIYKKIKSIFVLAKKFVLENPPDDKRLDFTEKLKEKIINLMISVKNKTDFIIRIFNRIDKYIDSLFLFVKYKEISATNNQAERDLRPFVIFRKASFGSFSFKGAKARVVFKTLFENYKRMKIPLNQTLDFVFENYKKNLLSKT